MLIRVSRHTPADLVLWAELEEADMIHGRSPQMVRKEEKAIDVICEFVAHKPCYAGVSWGKDSTVLAHLVWRSMARLKYAIPLVWVRVEPIANPDCDHVKNAFLERFYCDYHEVVEHCTRDIFGEWHASGTLERGFARAADIAGMARHLSGVRGEESGDRTRRMRKWGTTTIRTCAPIGWWTAGDIYGYLASYDLPVHPAYAMSGSGRFPRERLRVASLGGRRGDGMGRAEWEREYYGETLRRLESRTTRPVDGAVAEG